ncbi:MAG: zinc ribbon domain-containing protein [Clostridium sp.]|uniref:zinc ribbon domain-containing protein n=1 Tax=Clostridium sp. TaxID=1506 RepID=UPI0029077469|nr:zinc ribbon domain-containing protein [Clostridium sp.]MDU7339370.1 zinc ribbon domain-containing protein [Clostridium sp.]
MFCKNCGSPIAEKSKFCGNCGQQVIILEENKTQNVNATKIPISEEKINAQPETMRPKGKGMKTAKLVIGIISIVLSILILFQSCAAGVAAAIIDTNDTSGGTGFFVAILFLIAGIVGVAARESKGGAIAAAILYGIAGLAGVIETGVFKDLQVWGILAFIFAIVFAISVSKQNYAKSVPTKTE